MEVKVFIRKNKLTDGSFTYDVVIAERNTVLEHDGELKVLRDDVVLSPASLKRAEEIASCLCREGEAERGEDQGF